MPNLATRLDKLEAKLGIGRQPARVIFVRGGKGQKGDVSTFLISQGVRETDGDLTVFHTIYEGKDGSATGEPLQLISVTPLGSRRRVGV